MPVNGAKKNVFPPQTVLPVNGAGEPTPTIVVQSNNVYIIIQFRAVYGQDVALMKSSQGPSAPKHVPGRESAQVVNLVYLCILTTATRSIMKCESVAT
jgi:hypothetical protein